MTQFLPYHCPRLNGNFFKPPCARQIESAEERLAESPDAMLGFLGKCLECGGKDLVERVVQEEALSVVKPSDSLPENRKAMVHDELKSSSGKAPLTVQDCQNEGENMPEIMTAQEIPTAPRCPKHSNEPQVQCGPDSKRAGQYLGACKVCIAERKVGWKAGKAKNKMTPAVARDLGIAPGSQAKTPVCQNPPVEPETNVHPDPLPTETYPLSAFADEVPLCTRSDCEAPGSPVKIDKLGRSMGMCEKCVSARGRKVGIESHQLGRTSPPVSIPLNQTKYADIREWLLAQAEENERTLQAEIMYRLKMAMRWGSVK